MIINDQITKCETKLKALTAQHQEAQKSNDLNAVIQLDAEITNVKRRLAVLDDLSKAETAKRAEAAQHSVGSEELEALQIVADLIAGQGLKPSSKDYVARLNAKKTAKCSNVQNVLGQIENNNAEIKAAQDKLVAASNALNADEAIVAGDELARLKTKASYLKVMLDNERKKSSLSREEIEQEWTALCKEVLPTWKDLMSQMQVAAKIYRETVGNAAKVADFLNEVKAAYKKAAKAEGTGFDPVKVFTCGITDEDLSSMRIMTQESFWLFSMVYPLSGKAL